jgi:hypothetical protein
VCDRDEGFEVDLHVVADIKEFMRVWAGRSTWRQAIDDGLLTLDGPRPLVRSFPTWFALSPFATRSWPQAAPTDSTKASTGPRKPPIAR